MGLGFRPHLLPWPGEPYARLSSKPHFETASLNPVLSNSSHFPPTYEADWAFEFGVSCKEPAAEPREAPLRQVQESRSCGQLWSVVASLCLLIAKEKLLSRVQLFATPWAVAYQAPQSMEFSRQEYWSRLPFPSPGDLPNPGTEPGSPTLQADTLLSDPPGKPVIHRLKVSESCSVMSDSLWPHGLYSPWNSPGHNTGVSISFSRGLPHPGIKPRSPALQADSLQSEPPGKPGPYSWDTEQKGAQSASVSGASASRTSC